jgi:LmbE family N-acetylglucosaminyl deacetylase
MDKHDRMWSKNVAIIVAHPDDETLWAGGTILSHPSWKCFILSLCRRNDKDRAPRFYQALQILRSHGNMGGLDDSPDQLPLDGKKVEQAILDLLPSKQFDLIISHNPSGEYTRHIRHEEVSKAVIELWHANKISTDELWTFAYGDGNKSYYPRAVQNASIHLPLTQQLLEKKYKIITETYGFDKSSWEAKTTPKEESFWQFSDVNLAKKWLDHGGILL